MAAVEPDQYRRKYQEAVTELEREEKRWKAVEDVLRRIVGRLCIGARGLDEALDTELGRLGQAVRKTAEAPELESLLTALSAAVGALDKKQKAAADAGASVSATAPAAASAPATGTAATAPAAAAAGPDIAPLLTSLLDRLDLLPELEGQVGQLRQALAEARGHAALADACSKIADLANTQRAQLERDKAHVAAILQQVTGKLDDIAAYLVREAADQESARGNSDELNRRMLNEVRSLDTSVK